MLLVLIVVSSLPCFCDVSRRKRIGQSCLEAQSMILLSCDIYFSLGEKQVVGKPATIL